MIDEYIQQVDRALKNKTLPSLSKETKGLSSYKIRCFLNAIGKNKHNYLEVGCFKGSTTVSALEGNQQQIESAIIIDKFSKSGASPQDIYKLMEKIQYTKYELIASDCFESECLQKLDKLNKRFSLYLYDGNHKYIRQYNAFAVLGKYLTDVSIVMVDDWNGRYVRQGTKDAFRDQNYIVHKEWKFTSPGNGHKKGWWNGFYIAVIEK